MNISRLICMIALVGCSQEPASSNAPRHAAPLTEASSTAADAAKFIQTPEKGRRQTVSLVALLANPEKYRGADVSVYGYFARDAEPPLGNLFSERDSAEYGMLPNSVHITLDRCSTVTMPQKTLDPATVSEIKDTREGYVLVQGVFEPYARGAQVGAICALQSMGRLNKVREISTPLEGSSGSWGGGAQKGSAAPRKAP